MSPSQKNDNENEAFSSGSEQAIEAEVAIMNQATEALLAEHKTFVLEEHKKFRKMAKTYEYIHHIGIMGQRERITSLLMGVTEDCDRSQMAKLEKLKERFFESLDKYECWATLFIDQALASRESRFQEHIANMVYFTADEVSVSLEHETFCAGLRIFNLIRDTHLDHVRDLAEHGEKLESAIAQVTSSVASKRSRQLDAASVSDENPCKKRRTSTNNFYHYR